MKDTSNAYIHPNKVILLKGNKYFKLLVLEDYRDTSKKLGKQHFCKCLCDCGNITHVYAGNLVSGNTKSCGCLNEENRLKTIHGFAGKNTSPIKAKFYRIYRHIIIRNTYDKYEYYDIYSKKGVCTRWLIFENFMIDMWESFQEHYYNHDGDTEIERIDNEKGYSPENCRWATRKEQMNNTSKSKFITYKGETHTLSEWADKLNIAYYNLSNRLRHNWTVERAFETPVLRKD